MEMPGAQGGILLGPWGSNRLENALIVGSTPFSRVPASRSPCDGGPCHGQTLMGLEVAAWNRLTVSNVTFANCTRLLIGPLPAVVIC
jgi:hypothetical protein